MKRSTFLAATLGFALLLAIASGALAIPRITFERFERHSGLPKLVVDLVFFGPSFFLAALITASLAALARRRSPVLAVVVTLTLAIILFPSFQLAGLVVVTAVFGDVVIDPSLQGIAAGVTSLLFGIVGSVLVIFVRHDPL